jgi:uncharacterized protein YjdB
MPPEPVVASVVITSDAPPTFGSSGRTFQFTAQARDASGNVLTRTISWSSSSTSVATISSAGLLTTVGSGSTQIRATSEGVQSSAVTVTVNQVTASVEVTPAAVTFGARGSTRQLAAAVKDSAGATIAGRTASWSSNDVAVATVNTTGLVTSQGEGSAKVIATADSKADTTDVTVALVVFSVVVTPGSKTFGAAGSTQQFAATPRDSNASDIAGRIVVWSSTNINVVTVDASGLATSVANGAAQVQAMVDGVTGAANVTVDIVVLTLSVSPTSRTFTRIGQTQDFTVTATDSNANPIANPGVTWVSRDNAVATVSTTGTATSVADGSTYVVATATSDATKRDSAVATVNAVANAVTVTPSSVVFGALGSTRQLTASVLDSGGTTIPGRGVNWSVAGSGTTVNLTTTGSNTADVTSVAVGDQDTAVATAAGPAGNIEGRSPIQVTQVVFSVTVTSPSGTTPDTLRTTGRQRQFSAEAADTNGNAFAASFAWSSTNTGVATVDQTGLVTAVEDGTAQIEATSGGVTGSRPMVVQRYASVFTLFPTGPITLTSAGATQVFDGTAQDSSGANLLISWLSRNTGVATVSPASGTSTTATAVANGTTQVVMSGGTRSDSASLTVDIPVSFANQVQPIFTNNCARAGCHAGATPQEGMNLSAGSAYAAIVNVPSNQQPSLLRVNPGNPDLSYLVRKIEGGPNITGSRMPEGGPFLSSADVATIRNWIAQGAPNN